MSATEDAVTMAETQGSTAVNKKELGEAYVFIILEVE